jgi:predicted RNA-binding Zn-ribbon protein involved in translation (DUF1610 family)
MGSGTKIICRECGQLPAVYRCTQCGYVICRKCPKRLGGGMFSNPKCPICGNKEWKGVHD